MWKGSNTHGIMKKDGEINFSKLEQQIDTAVAADKTYNVQNDAKIRAVTNKVASYEEFVDIVKASHLKPLEKGDRISDIKVFKQPWNISAGSGEGVRSKPSVLDCGGVKDVNQFNRAWKRTCKTDSERYSFVLSLGVEKIQKMFHAEIGMGFLGEIVAVFNTEYAAEDAEQVASILYILSQCSRFELSLQFLSQKENDFLQELFTKLIDGGNSENVDQLKSIYNKTC